jgi:predicted phage tail protein
MTDSAVEIYGAGGGGGGAFGKGGGGAISSATEARDNLQSRAVARVLDLISEGEIEGLADGYKSIYFDDTPLQSASGENNFTGYTIRTRNGSNSQEYIAGFSSVERVTPVGVEIQADNNISGTWSRDWSNCNFTRSAATITIGWTGHGMSTSDSVFLNFEKYNGVHDALYVVTAVDANTFTVQRKNTGFTRTAGVVYAIKPYLKITATGSWAAGNLTYVKFLEGSLDTARDKSSLYTTNGANNSSYPILSTPAPTGSLFYVAWKDKPGDLKAAVVDGGDITVSTSTYTKSGATITVNKTAHGYSVGMSVQLNFLSGSLQKVIEIFTVATKTTNSFTVTRNAGVNTGTGTYYVDVPIPGGAIIRTVSDPEVDRVRVTISVPSLQALDKKGNLVGGEFNFAIDVQLNGGAYVQYTPGNQTSIKGKSSGGYQFDREIALAGVPGWNSGSIAGNFPLNIRLRRVSEDSESAKVSSAFSWQSYTEIIDAKLRYPNSALIGVEVDSKQFSNIPKRTYLIKGIKVRIPSNATVDSATGRLIYSGTWNGTFSAATWCSCPAWILWDILTSTRYGFGEQILTASEKASFDGNASRLDKWSFYAASQYANQLVTTGLATPAQEPRFSCNVNIQNSEEAFTLVNNLLSVFRSQGYWSGGSVTIAQDRPKDSSYIFGPSNVIDGFFNYQGSDIRTRPTVILVRYNDLETRDTAVEVVEDSTLLAKYGVVKQEVEAFACTSQSQAARVGRWLLYSNAYEAETCTFACAVDSGVVLRPGMIISIADPTKSGTRMSGRISSATTTTIVIDANRTINAGNILSVVLPNGLLETRTINSYNSGTLTITVTSAFSVAPQNNAPWLLTSGTVEPTTWRVIGVSENSEEGTFGVTALSYNPSKYAYIETGAVLTKKLISVLGTPPDSPTNIQVAEAMYADNNKAFVQVNISWSGVERANLYKIQYRIGNDNWINLPDTSSTETDIFNAQEGNWEIQIVAVSASNKKSIPANASYQVVGRTAPPAAIVGIEISQTTEQFAELGWSVSTDLDVLLGGKIIVRHTPTTTGAEWQGCNDIIPAVPGNATKAVVPLLAGTYMVKAEDSTGNRSTDPVSVTVTLPQPLSPFTVVAINENNTSPPFQGTLTNMLYSSEQNGLILDQGIFIDSLAPDGDFDSLPSVDGVGDIVPSGEYEFFNTLDLGAIYDTDIVSRFVTRAFLPGDRWDDRLDEIDLWADIEGSTLDSVNAALYVRTTYNDSTIEDPDYTAWQPVINGTRQGRGFQFKVVATSKNVTQNIAIEELGATVQLKKRQENSNNVTSGAGAYTVTFTNAFYGLPSIGISGQDMATGDYYALSSVTRNGFTVTFKNSAGTNISRTFDWQAVGYGKQLA